MVRETGGRGASVRGLTMPFGLSRRSFVRRAAATTTLAALPLSEAAGDEASAHSPQAGAADTPSRLRQLADRLRAATGAALVGFARRDPGATGRTVEDKLREWPAITDFGAVADDRTDATPSIQRAIDAVHAAGGGILCIPTGTFRITACVRLRSNVTLQGMGWGSVLHCVNTDRSGAVRGEGRATDRLMRVGLRDLAIVGDVRFAAGKPTVVNGGGISLIHADDCSITGVRVIGFSDGGIAVLDGNRNSIANCHVAQTAQGISFTASDTTVSGNVAIGNRIVDTGAYNGLHLEGGFGGGRNNGEVRHTTLTGNTVAGSWEAGINIELAPYTACVGNTVDRSGLGRSPIDMGIKLYGGYRSAVCGNTILGSSGDGIVVGANSGECAIDGNVTAGNGGSLLLTDSAAQVTNDVAIGTNSFTEGDIRFQGNVRLRNRTQGFSFANRSSADPHMLDWYEEGRFTPRASGRGGAWAVRNAAFTRIGNVVHIACGIEGRGAADAQVIVLDALPYPVAIDTPLTATLSDTSGAGEASCFAALASGHTVTLRLPPRDDRARPWRVAVAGPYLTAS